MKVFTFYDGSTDAPPNQARMIKLWAESWEKHGWIPRLLTKRTMGNYKPRSFAYSPRLKGIFVPSNAINVGLKRRPKSWTYIIGQVPPPIIGKLIHDTDYPILIFHEYNPQQVLDFLKLC